MQTSQDISGNFWQPMKTNVVIVELSKDAILPQRADPGAAGYDLFSLEDLILAPMERKCVSTGVKMVIPEEYYGRVAPRSGLAYNYGIDVLAGVIDSSYRGEIKVILINFGDKDFKITPGDKIAQLIFEKIITPNLFNGDVTNYKSERGSDGFGSSGYRRITTN